MHVVYCRRRVLSWETALLLLLVKVRLGLPGCPWMVAFLFQCSNATVSRTVDKVLFLVREAFILTVAQPGPRTYSADERLGCFTGCFGHDTYC